MRKFFIILAILGILSLSCALPFQITFNPPTDQTELDQAKADLALTITAQALTLAEASNERAQETNTPLAPIAENTTSQGTPTPNLHL